MSNFNDFVDLVHGIKDKDMLEDLLLGIMTPKERDELGRRLEIVQLLVKGESQVRIAKLLGVGIATVTRGSKELSAGRFKILRKK